ncbi:MAG: hypothetical protein AAFZ92_03070 [Pseudomonadota bacterium]
MSTIKFFFTAVLLIALNSACSVQHQTNADAWPHELPPKQYFVDYHYSEGQPSSTQDKYLLWVKRFYMGWELYRPGWLAASNDLVATLPSQAERKLAKEKTTLIGQLVAREWAKENRDRIIDTRHLSIWGNALNQSIVKQEQLSMLGKILDDVKTLLNEELQPQHIVAFRYYETHNVEDSFGDSFE